MRIRVLLEDSFFQGIHPSAEVLGSADGTVTAVVWHINPNIPIGSPVHLEKLAAMLALGDGGGGVADTSELALFTVTWLSPTEWQAGSYIDPARTAYALQLREDASVLLTRDPYSVMVASQLLQASSTTTHDPLAADEASLFWAPLPTAALSLQTIWGDEDDDKGRGSSTTPAAAASAAIALAPVGSTRRRVWKRYGDDIWSLRGCVAVFGFPPATTTASASTGGGGLPPSSLMLKRQQPSTSHVQRKFPSGRTSFAWTFRIGYRDPSRTIATSSRVAGAAVPPFGGVVGKDDSGAVIHGDTYFVEEKGKQRGSSVMVASSPPQNEGGQAATSDEDDDDDVEDEPKIGVPLPSLLLGFALRQALEDAAGEAAEGARVKSGPQSGSRTPRTPRDGAPSSPSSGRSGGVVVFDAMESPATSMSPALSGGVVRRIFELPAMFESCCLFDTITGRVHLGSSSTSRPIYADLDSYACRNGMMLSFGVDMVEGIINIRQDDRLVLVASLPPRMREELAELAATLSDETPATALLSAGGSVAWSRHVAPVAQVGSKGTYVDIF